MEITSYLLGKKAGGGETPTGTIEITQNGITNVSSYASADVNVQPNLQSKEVSITSNGSSTISPDSNYDGLSSISLTTNVQPNLETKSITITENTTTTLTPTSGKDGMSSVSITTNVSGGGGLDWSAIGYSEVPISIQNGYDYAVEVMNNFIPSESLYFKFSSNKNLIYMPLVNTSITTNMSYAFYNCENLNSLPLLDTSNVTDMRFMCRGCLLLKDVPILDTSKAVQMQNAFQNTPKLSDNSLDNILQMCINATSYTETKTLNYIGFNSVEQKASKIQALPHYQDFIDAGWTIGY